NLPRETASMTYDEIISGLDALRASDFDDSNIDARGREKLYELTDAIMSLSSPERAIPALFAVVERLPDADLGSPGPLVHTLERLPGYERGLMRSARRRPTLLSVWMVNGILNTAPPQELRQACIALLNEAAKHPKASKTVRDCARQFLEL